MPERREAVLDALRGAKAPMSILDLAGQLGLHANTVRFHLRALVEGGRVERVEPTRSSPGRPPLMFRAHGGMDPAGPRNYQALADALATRLSEDNESTDKAIDAGRAWGRRISTARTSAQEAGSEDQATDELVEILGDLGFSPQRRSSAGATQIILRHCPFLDLVPEHQDVICPVHLGLMQGAMAAMTAQTTVERLQPFAEPDVCVAHMRSSAATS